MANVLPVLVLMHLGCCTTFAIRRDKATCGIHTDNESNESNFSVSNSSVSSFSVSFASTTSQLNYTGPSVSSFSDHMTWHGDAWTVFQEITWPQIAFDTPKNAFDTVTKGSSQHSELLFCYLSSKEREKLKVNTEDQEVDKDKEHGWLQSDKKCYGVSYGTNGAAIYEKSLKENRMQGTKGDCDKTEKYFKGCIVKRDARTHVLGELKPANEFLPDETHETIIEPPIKKVMLDGWWLLEMIDNFNTCQPQAHNSNGFIKTLLYCWLGLSPTIHHGAFQTFSNTLSNIVSKPTCECAKSNPGPRKLYMNRAQKFWSCAGKHDEPSSELANLVCKDSVDRTPPNLNWKVAKNTKLFEVLPSGCYCKQENGEEVCGCKADCGRRDCGVKKEHTRCMWCCKRKPAPGVLDLLEFWSPGKHNKLKVQLDGPVGQDATCDAVQSRSEIKREWESSKDTVWNKFKFEMLKRPDAADELGSEACS